VGVDFKPYLVFDKESQGLAYLIFGLNYNQIDIKEVNQTETYSVFFGNKTSITSRNSSISKVSPVFGLGVEYLFYQNFALRLQYKRNFVDAKISNSKVLNKVKLVETLGVGISHAF
jgi:predicted porin